ncbi:MAG TPA: hypothetical protein VL475_06540 [Planctomycetaceae bacterium]|jgi:hypothetical protein|nr:hypothetical protein [Planctomycetaceae bacterium]
MELRPVDSSNYTSLEYILLGDLRELLEEPVNSESRRWMLSVLDGLLENLLPEGEHDADGSYMEDVLERFPNWSGQIERLYHDHDELFTRLKELRGRIERDEWIAPLANLVRRELRDWMLSLIAHRRRETRLLQTAMNLDVGGE